MTTILPSERSSFDLIGKQIGQNLHQVLPGAVQQGYNRGQLQNSLDEIKGLAGNSDTKPLDMLIATMKAGAGIPGSERYLGQIVPEIMKMVNARKSLEIPLAGEMVQGQQAQGQGQQGQGQQGQGQQLPKFLQNQKQPGAEQQSQFFPSNVGPQGGMGNVPQAATTGQKRPILDRKSQIEAARNLSSMSTKSGVALSVPEALEQVKEDQKDAIEHNKLVDKELEQRVDGQREYGNKAVDELRKVFGKDNGPTSEQEAIFKKKGEEKSREGESEAEIDRYLAKEAVKFKNMISNVKNDISAPRLQNKLHRSFLGTDKNFEQSSNDLRVKLKPLLDEGLYDTARNLLEQNGYYPEERESIINPMSERQKTALNRIPKAPLRYTVGSGMNFDTSPDVNIEDLKTGLRDLKKIDPNFSLLLSRKAFEDKNYDWRIYKDGLNDLIQNEEFELTDDQQNQLNYLDTPPLNLLQKALNGVGFIGR